MHKKILFVFIIGFMLIPLRAFAAKGTELPTCFMCDEQNQESYRAEKQMIDKITVITNVFNADGTKRIDPIVLAATVLQKYSMGATSYEYDSSYNKNDYKEAWNSVKSNASTASSLNSSSEGFGISSDTDQDVKRKVEENRKLDLVTTATMVMLDSNNFGAYDEDKYIDALIGDRLMGNVNDEDTGSIKDWFGAAENFLVCGVTQTFNVIRSPSDIVNGLFSGQNGVFIAASSVSNRLVDTQNVCSHGFIGGMYGVGNDIVKTDNLSEKDAKEKRKNLRRPYAQQIIDLANYYKKYYGKDDDDNACYVSEPSGDFASWKQADTRWGSIQLGSSSSATMKNIGCYVTSMAIQIARSGTSLNELPSSFSSFNPGAFATSLKENSGFTADGSFIGGYQALVPNLRIGDKVNVDKNNYASKIEEELSSKTSDGSQKYLMLKIYHDGGQQHWVAVNSVSNGKVTIFDPAKDGDTLEENYKDFKVDSYTVLYFTDVKDGGTSSGSSETSSNKSTSKLSNFLAYLEGGDNNTCNYNGQGSGTGYGVEILNDGAGPTTAYGLTKYDNTQAQNIGYTSYLSDLNNGCTNKEYIDKMKETASEPYANYVTSKFSDLALNNYEKDALTSVAYGGYTGVDNLANSIRENGKTSEAVYKCFNTLGCSFSNSNYTYALSLRRMAEFELFRSGNYNAAKPEYLKTYSEIQALSMEDFMKKWPSRRDSYLVDEDTGCLSTSGTCGMRIATLAVEVAGTADPEGRIKSPGNGDSECAFNPSPDSRLAKYNQLNASRQMDNHAYASCTQAAAAVIDAAADPAINSHGPQAQWYYLAHSDKWQEVKIPAGANYEDYLQPGDVGENGYHSWIYVGNEVAKARFPDTRGNIFEASFAGCTNPGIDYVDLSANQSWTYFTTDGSYYRFIGDCSNAETNQQPDGDGGPEGWMGK